jgi:hypothetical protein
MVGERAGILMAIGMAVFPLCWAQFYYRAIGQNAAPEQAALQQIRL